MLEDAKKEYRDDSQRFKLFTMGYKEMIKKLENEN
jgi:hypothetical protein